MRSCENVYPSSPWFYEVNIDLIRQIIDSLNFFSQILNNRNIFLFVFRDFASISSKRNTFITHNDSRKYSNILRTLLWTYVMYILYVQRLLKFIAIKILSNRFESSLAVTRQIYRDYNSKTWNGSEDVYRSSSIFIGNINFIKMNKVFEQLIIHYISKEKCCLCISGTNCIFMTAIHAVH